MLWLNHGNAARHRLEDKKALRFSIRCGNAQDVDFVHEPKLVIPFHHASIMKSILEAEPFELGQLLTEKFLVSLSEPSGRVQFGLFGSRHGAEFHKGIDEYV